MSKPTKYKAWGGFSDGRLHIHQIDDLWGGRNARDSYAIFKSREQARQQYQDVRKIEIIVVEPKP